jgi:CIC family chloride channel protein
MTAATVANVRDTERAVASWLASTGWAIVLGAASGSACVAVRLFFRALQWIFVQQTGMLPLAAATLPPARRILTPLIGAALATFVVWMMRRSAPDLRFEEYVEAVRLRNGRIPLLSTIWRTASSAFSVATGAAIGREGSMIQFAAAISSWVGERSPMRNLSLSRQVTYGAAAAVAAAYQAPIAGVFFATEIVLDEWAWSDGCWPRALVGSLAAFSWAPDRSSLQRGHCRLRTISFGFSLFRLFWVQLARPTKSFFISQQQRSVCPSHCYGAASRWVFSL